MKLTCRGKDVRNIFDLLGDTENDMTFSLGWVLASSDKFLAALLRDLTGRRTKTAGSSVVKLQTGRAQIGITDVEIELGADLTVIIEAKRGPTMRMTTSEIRDPLLGSIYRMSLCSHCTMNPSSQYTDPSSQEGILRI